MLKRHIIKFDAVGRPQYLLASPIRQYEHRTNKIVVVFENLELQDTDIMIIKGRRADGTSLPSLISETPFDNDDIRMRKVVLSNDIRNLKGEVLIPAGTETYEFILSNKYTIVAGPLELAIFVVSKDEEDNDIMMATGQFVLKVEEMPLSDIAYEGAIP